MDREEAKVGFFTWLYSPKDTTFERSIYNRGSVLDKFMPMGALQTHSTDESALKNEGVELSCAEHYK